MTPFRLNHASFSRLVLALLGLSLFAAACSTVPVTGRSALNLIPDGQANALGADAYQQVLTENRIITSGPDYERVVRVGRALAEVSNEPSFVWDFNLIDDDKQVNAFCLPGGKVAVYSGILPVCQNADGLAVVMGHEIAHAVARHGSERMTNGLAFEIGGMGLEALLGEKSPQSRQLILAAYGMGGQVGILLPFSRNHESEADRIGLIYMAKAGYDPQEAPRFWERMNAAGGARPPAWLSTHPDPANRVRDLQKWMPEALSYYQK